MAELKKILGPEETSGPTADPTTKSYSRSRNALSGANLTARGEPFLWGMGGALVLGILMVVGFLFLIFWNGVTTFYPKAIRVLTLKDSSLVAGEPTRHNLYTPTPEMLAELDDASTLAIEKNQGLAKRTLYRTGNYDLYNEDFKWVSEFQIQKVESPEDIYFFERVEWGAFIGFIKSVQLKDTTLTSGDISSKRLLCSPKNRQQTAKYDSQNRTQRNRRREPPYRAGTFEASKGGTQSGTQ